MAAGRGAMPRSKGARGKGGTQNKRRKPAVPGSERETIDLTSDGGETRECDGDFGGEDEELQVFDDRRLGSSEPPSSTGSQGMSQGEGHCALSAEIETFVRRASPSRKDEEEVEEVLSQIREIAASLWPDGTVVLFGSRATGLALPGGDLDVGILNIFKDIKKAGSGEHSSALALVWHCILIGF